MAAYYNEIEKNAANWLRELIKEGHIAPGDVDERSIVDVRPDDLSGYCQVHFFAGVGGWSRALRLGGWPDNSPVWTGSCPCQPFSLAGQRAGFDDARHLWPEFRRLIAERRPATVFGEQVASAAAWLRLVRSDLEAMEYAVGTMPIEAASAGADHLRDRFWFVANCAGEQVGAARQPRERGDVGDGSRQGLAFRSIAEEQRRDLREEGPPVTASGAGSIAVADAYELERGLGDEQPAGEQPQPEFDPSSRDSWVIGADGKARRVKPGVRLLVNGFPSRVGLLRGFGNAIDPRPAAAFIEAASDAMRADP